MDFALWRLPVEFNKQTFQLQFIVLKSNSTLILGLNGSKKLGLINGLDSITFQQQHIFSMFPDVFNGIGCVPGHRTINLDSVLLFSFDLAEKYPLPLKNEPHEMETMGIIARVEEPTEWVTSLVIVEKKMVNCVCAWIREISIKL